MTTGGNKKNQLELSKAILPHTRRRESLRERLLSPPFQRSLRLLRRRRRRRRRRRWRRRLVRIASGELGGSSSNDLGSRETRFLVSPLSFHPRRDVGRRGSFRRRFRVCSQGVRRRAGPSLRPSVPFVRSFCSFCSFVYLLE